MLRGRVFAQLDGPLIVDVGGVGYEVATTAGSLRTLRSSGTEVTLFVHTHVKEDILQLYGFQTTEERDAFRRLLSISNVGPRLALTILSGLSVEDLARAVSERDVARLASLPGIGKKTAERLTVELQGKFSRPIAAAVRGIAAGERADLVSALVNLGYKPAQAEKAATSVGDRLAAGGAFEDVLREALRSLTRPG